MQIIANNHLRQCKVIFPMKTHYYVEVQIEYPLILEQIPLLYVLETRWRH